MHTLLTFVVPRRQSVVKASARARSHWRLASLPLLLTATLWPLDPAFAQALTPIATVATNIATALQGPFAVAVATIGLIGCGFLAMSGRMPWSAAIAVIGGIILIFGAATLVTEIQGVAAN